MVSMRQLRTIHIVLAVSAVVIGGGYLGHRAFDRKYAPFALLSFTGAPSYFPADARTLLLSARYDFK